ncbi:hypothetical protein L3X38_025012 [Prunus dulcis]|uniref:Uncharacterized protein n=1 Tax=Prunus dulcis TaxID=3755 RepID=A0AAD4W2H2_PRUDU|nr:hypothetical protein L3X38_025012 [Prunus dulcis]
MKSSRNLSKLMLSTKLLQIGIDLYEFREDEVLYPDHNSGSISSEVEGTDVEQMADFIAVQLEKGRSGNLQICCPSSD